MRTATALQFTVSLALLTLGRSDFTPPLINISLDKPPEDRWLPLRNHFNDTDYQSLISNVIDTTVPKFVHHAVVPIAAALEKYISQPYAGEILGLSKIFEVNIGDIILLNLAYEITAFCTSIVAQDTKGNLYHGRNLDYPHVDILRNFTVDVQFLKNGQVAYKGTTFAGFIGLWTGQSAKKFTVSGNERAQGHWWENAIAAFLLRNFPVSWLLRQTLEEAEDFQDAVVKLSKIPIIADVYYIVAGVHPKEGVVVTRNRESAADIWLLNPLAGVWYLVETNYDHWKKPPPHDDRRTPAMKQLNITGQSNINFDTLYQALSVKPTLNSITVYTTTMSAAMPDMYQTQVREVT
ncbi:N-acylethanolamine-hydrolyzing acid amidase-like [Erpetoichthys calabaricus]|uniref:N-acylethanolamine-hydrolyzing acid amidase n=1 Tax=Erpetoichthys calabaricus TaxID=27687 RepID=A0A8C4RFU5_ERPCA|nr:N-acylethanolamine-hydrolyzing acid amidase-like [Erpetoichthys calabaricus]